MVAGGLGAVFAVLPTAAAASIDGRAEINMLASEMALQAPCVRLKQRQGRIEQEREIILCSQSATCEDGLRQLFELFFCIGTHGIVTPL